jgi:hypothetical protein
MTITWRPPIVVDHILTSTEAFQMMDDARDQDNAHAGAYYHMLLAAEDSVDQFLGLGNLAGATPADAPDRVAMTMVTEHRVDSQMDTIAHEMGHNLGRLHTPGCGADGVDDSYPYPNTGVGVDGYSIGERLKGSPHLPNSTGPFKSKATFKDVMGYCYPTWISDYTWNAFADRMRIVTAFPTATVTATPRRSLRGYQARGGEVAWVVVRGGTLPDDAVIDRTATVEARDGSRATVAVAVRSLLSPNGPEELRSITIPLPNQEVKRVEALVDGRRLVVRRGDVKGL